MTIRYRYPKPNMGVKQLTKVVAYLCGTYLNGHMSQVRYSLALDILLDQIEQSYGADARERASDLAVSMVEGNYMPDEGDF